MVHFGLKSRENRLFGVKKNNLKLVDFGPQKSIKYEGWGYRK